MQSPLAALAGKRVVVTGACGFIGSHLVEALVRHGARVKALVLYNALGHWGWLEQVPLTVRAEVDVVMGDVRDPHLMRGIMTGSDLVLHLAALISIPFSYLSPDAYLETNLRGTLNVLQAARDADISRIVCASTSEVYGTARYVPMDEDHPLAAQSPYAASKVGADQMALAFHRSFALPVVIVRPFNTFGPRQSARAVIPTIISQIRYGASELRLGSLHPTRDFLYVDDTVNGFLHAAVVEGTFGETINLGTGFDISVGETARTIADLMGARVTVVQAAERVRPPASEVERLCANAAKARALLGWEPVFAGREGFALGLEQTIEWFSNPANLAGYTAERYAI